MSSILEAIAAEQAAFRKGPKCSVETLLDAVPTDERDDVASAIDDPSIPLTLLSRALTKAGHKIGADTIGRHRKGDCACRKS